MPSAAHRTLPARAAAVLLAVTALLSACGPGGAGAGPPLTGRPAPELVGLTGWIHSEPLTPAGLRTQGRVVLVDFWTYTCVNCLRTLPFLAQWHARYDAGGLTIIGVHAPEFDFERDAGNVRAAVAAQGIGYAVAQDNDLATWRAFDNAVWPAKYLVGADGAVRYVHLGEGGYDATELAIRAALTAAGRDVSGIATGGVAAPAIDPAATGITRELYGGYERNYAAGVTYAAQPQYYAGPNETHDYTDVTGPRRHHRWYLQGRWRNEAQAIVHARATDHLEDYLALRFVARSANAVLHPGAESDGYDVVVQIDGRPLARNEAGRDVHFDAGGQSVVTVREPRMYSLVMLPRSGDHELTLDSNSSRSLYAVTFGVYVEGT